MNPPPPAPKSTVPLPDAAGRMVVARFQDGRMVKGTTRDFHR